MSAASQATEIRANTPSAWQWTWQPYTALSLDTLHDVLALRQRVFVVEQHCAYLDITGADRDAWHLCGWQVPTEGAGAGPAILAAYARVFAPGVYDASGSAVVGRVVVAPEYRNRGLGRAVVAEALGRLFKDMGPVPSKLSAQAHLESLYNSLGYVTSGPGFLEDDIPHLPMARPALPAPSVVLASADAPE